MSDKLEITLRIALDRTGLSKRLKRSVEDDTAFFILGLVHAQLTSRFGDDNCQVEMESASGVSTSLIQSMNQLPRGLKQALDALEHQGEAVVANPDVLAALRALHDLTVTPVGGKWRVARPLTPGVKH